MVNTDFDIGILAYPWDVLDDLEALEELADSGCSSVSIASAYHSVRQLRPRGAGPIVREEPTAALHWQPNPASFRGAKVLPVVAGTPSSEEALQAVTRLPFRRFAWISVLHSSALAARYPSLALRTATGDLLAHALCPSRPEVVDYGRRLVGDAALNLDVDGLEVEATGFHGWAHGSRHDKAGVVIDRVRNFLLSVCFCEGCSAVIRDEGGDPHHCRQAFADAIRAALARDRIEPIEFFLASEPLATVLAARASVVQRFTAAVLESAGRLPVLIHAGADPLATGSRAVLSSSALAQLPVRPEGIVVSTDGMGDAPACSATQSAVDHYGSAVWMSMRVQQPDINSSAALSARLVSARELGVSGVRLHNFGLWNEAQLDWVRSSAAARRG